MFALTAAVAIGGCGTQPLAPAVPPGAAPAPQLRSSGKGAGAFVYTCQNEGTADCLVYSGHRVLRTITKDVTKPVGIAAGKDGLFYVADESALKIWIFSSGGRKLVGKLSDGKNVPDDVAVYNDEAAVSNQKTLTFFSKGATKPTRTLKDSSAQQGRGAAFDSQGNCYWSFENKSSATQVDEFKGCSGSPKNLKISGGSPYGIALDATGNLYFTAYNTAGRGVYRCKGFASCKLVWSSFVDPQYVNFSKGFSDLWVSDPANYQSTAALYEIDLSTGKVIDTISYGFSSLNPPIGVAAGPGPL
ncbi:MAG: hypothetical protein WAK16_08665 [Candidatus Cybelea sp.]